MIKTIKKLLPIAVSFLLFISSITPAIAQENNSWAIRLSQITTVEKPDAMNLKVYFSVYDPKTDLPILDIGAKGAEIAMPQSNYLAGVELKKPDVPIYVVMVLDASGSMSGAAENLRESAKLALNNTPDNSFFSVVQFNEEIKLIQDFTQNIPAISFAIDQYKTDNKGTCLYDATWSAVESLSKAPAGRRAVILFTDGRDETADGNTCSKHSYQELVAFTQAAQIPVSTIGLSYKESGLNEVELKGLAASTGGYSAIAKQDDLSMGFENIMNGLKAQWMVDASVYPKKGTNQTVLTLKLKDDQTIGSTFAIESATEYEGPPSPVTGRMAGLTFKPENQSYDIQLTMSSPELVQYVKVEVWDTKGGLKVAEYQFTELQQNNVFNISTEQFIAGHDYQLRMTAISKADQRRFGWTLNSDGKKLQELIHPFLFDPSSSLPSLEILSVAQQENDLVLNIQTTNQQFITGLDGWMVDENTNTQVSESNFNIPANGTVLNSITIPLSKTKVPAGKYTAVVRVLGKDNQVYATIQYPGIVYTPKLPNMMEMVYTLLIAAPIVIVAIIVMILGLVVFLMFQSNHEKSLTGTPALQGRLGGRISSKNMANGPVIPVNDAEPLLKQRPVTPSGGANQYQKPLQNPNAAHANPFGNGGETIMAPASIQSPLAAITVTGTGNFASPQGKIMLAEYPYIIGRTEGKLIIPDANVSRKHAQISYNEVSRSFYITDLNSSNGTRLNGQALAPGQPTQLVHGSTINLGPNVILRFEIYQ